MSKKQNLKNSLVLQLESRRAAKIINERRNCIRKVVILDLLLMFMYSSSLFITMLYSRFIYRLPSEQIPQNPNNISKSSCSTSPPPPSDFMWLFPLMFLIALIIKNYTLLLKERFVTIPDTSLISDPSSAIEKEVPPSKKNHTSP